LKLDVIVIVIRFYLSLIANPKNMKFLIPKKQLEEILDIPISGFSYPFGKEKHYNQDTLNILKELGFSYACTSIEEPVSKSSDVYLLPRMFVYDWNGEELLRNINKLLNSY